MYDVHSHFVPRRVLEWLEHHNELVPMSLEERVIGKEPFLTVNHKWAFELKRLFFDPDAYLLDQQAAGVVHTLVSPIPQLFLYDLSPDVTRAVSELYNEELASWVNENRRCLSGLATIPLNTPDMLPTLLLSSRKLGLKGAIIGPGHQGIPLSDARFREMWQVADDTEAIIFIHPLLNQDPRIQRLKMPNMIGIPWETTVCALDLILGGILDTYPRVKILLAHGGGFLPYQVGRLAKARSVWPDVRQEMELDASDYLCRFWYDSVLWDERALAYLKSIVGEARVLPGSDSPFDLREWPPVINELEPTQMFLSLPRE